MGTVSRSSSSRGPWEQSQAWARRRSARCASNRRIAASSPEPRLARSPRRPAGPPTRRGGPGAGSRPGRRRSGTGRTRAASRASRTARAPPGAGRRASGRRGRAVHRRRRRPRRTARVLHRAREHRHPVEQRPPLLVEESVGPRHDVAQRAVPGRGGPASAAQHPERLLRGLEGVEEPGQTQRERAGGGQLQGERQVVEPPAHLGDELVLRIGRRGGVAGLHPVDEQPGRRTRLQRRDRQHLFAVDPHRLPAGEQQVDAAVRPR